MSQQDQNRSWAFRVALFGFSALLCCAAKGEDMSSINFYVGTYNRSSGSSGEGIVQCRLHVESGRITEASTFSDIGNPSYLAITPDQQWLIAGSETRGNPGGNVFAFSIGANGQLEPSSSQPSCSGAVCHVAVSPNGQTVITAGYGAGEIDVHGFAEGKLSPSHSTIVYKGSGPNKKRQTSPHAHQATVSSDGRFLYVCDLGSDTVWIHDLAALTPSIDSLARLELPGGAGPRHLVLHPTLNKAYVFAELNSHVYECSRDPEQGLLTLEGEVDTLPVGYSGPRWGAAIRLHPSLRALYVSNRGHNSITVYTLDPEDGSLTFKERFLSDGETPRDFNIDPTGNWLIVAHQDSNTLIPFRLDPKTGLPTGEKGPSFSCGTPVCVVFPSAAP